MRAMLMTRTMPLGAGAEPLTAATLPMPEPGDGDVLLRVRACAVCHTELDEIEGRLPPPRLPVVPGHQVVGEVVGRGALARRHALGTRVGVGWIHHSSGGPDENLSPDFVATGRDVDGGYAEFMTVPERYAIPIPDTFTDTEAAPLLCGGAIGHRALRLCHLAPGARLGLMGFGNSAQLVIRLARHLDPGVRVHVFARGDTQRALALALGAESAGDVEAAPPFPLDAIIDTTPAWGPVVRALAALRPGGRLVINAIRKEDADRHRLRELEYHTHLWLEREIKSVANITADDIETFLPLAARAGIRPRVVCHPLEAANAALLALRRGDAAAAHVLVPALA
jgi:propanol-preferring alcohol dehydrogenase